VFYCSLILPDFDKINYIKKIVCIKFRLVLFILLNVKLYSHSF